ncbi:hypothetical protein HY523_00515, partial [Candidatus Berkelbacteria bacterium]|nr:hypothetical protein [Candidatus Berkelbacteria bacterium]
GTWNFTIRVPNDLPPGTYRLYTRLVAEHFAWLEDGGGAWWQITVG